MHVIQVASTDEDPNIAQVANVRWIMHVIQGASTDEDPNIAQVANARWIMHVSQGENAYSVTNVNKITNTNRATYIYDIWSIDNGATSVCYSDKSRYSYERRAADAFVFTKKTVR